MKPKGFIGGEKLALAIAYSGFWVQVTHNQSIEQWIG